LKPSEILVNEYCDVKICDIAQPMTTPPVNTYSSSHYRAPEVTFAWKKMSYDMDIWSAGCIFAEMLDGRPIFTGTDSKYQFWNIVEVLGTPSADLKAILGNETAEIMESLPKRDKISFSQRFGNITAIGTLPNSIAALIQQPLIYLRTWSCSIPNYDSPRDNVYNTSTSSLTGKRTPGLHPLQSWTGLSTIQRSLRKPGKYAPPADWLVDFR